MVWIIFFVLLTSSLRSFISLPCFRIANLNCSFICSWLFFIFFMMVSTFRVKSTLVIFYVVFSNFWMSLFAFSKHRPSGLMLSMSGNVRVFVSVSVCSILRYRLNVLLPPLQDGGCPKFRGSESLGISSGKKWSQIWIFVLKNGLKLMWQKKFLRNFIFFFHFWGTVKTSFCPHFPKSNVHNF